MTEQTMKPSPSSTGTAGNDTLVNIIGPGPIGCFLSECLERSHFVTLVGRSGVIHGSALECTDSGSVTLLTTKCGGLLGALQQHAPMINPAAIILAGNGMPDELCGIPANGAIALSVGVRWGRKQILQTVVAGTSTIVPVGREFSRFLLSRVETIARDLCDSGVPTIVVNDVDAGRVIRFRKLALNSITNGVAAVTQLNMRGIGLALELRYVIASLVEEINSVASLTRINFRITMEDAIGFLLAGKSHLPSSAAAVISGADPELDFINGHLVRIGAACGVATPMNALLVRLAARRILLPPQELLELATRATRATRATTTATSRELPLAA